MAHYQVRSVTGIVLHRSRSEAECHEWIRIQRARVLLAGHTPHPLFVVESGEDTGTRMTRVIAEY